MEGAVGSPVFESLVGAGVGTGGVGGNFCVGLCTDGGNGCVGVYKGVGGSVCVVVGKGVGGNVCVVVGAGVGAAREAVGAEMKPSQTEPSVVRETPTTA